MAAQYATFTPFSEHFGLCNLLENISKERNPTVANLSHVPNTYLLFPSSHQSTLTSQSSRLMTSYPKPSQKQITSATFNMRNFGNTERFHMPAIHERAIGTSYQLFPSLNDCTRPNDLQNGVQEHHRQIAGCGFCKTNGETEAVYSSHVLKERSGKIVCPVLRKYKCPKCGLSGDKAHTAKYCSLSKRSYWLTMNNAILEKDLSYLLRYV